VARIPRASRLPVAAADGARWRVSGLADGCASDLQAGVQGDLQGLCKDRGLTDRSETCETTRVERVEAPRCPPTHGIPVGRHDEVGDRRPLTRTRGATHRRVSPSLAHRATVTRTSPRGSSRMTRRVRAARCHGLRGRPLGSRLLVLIRCATTERLRPMRWTVRCEMPCALARNGRRTWPATSASLTSSVGVVRSGSRAAESAAATVVGDPTPVRPRPRRSARWLWHSSGMQGCGRVVASLLLDVSVARRVGVLGRVAADGGVGGCDPCGWCWCECRLLRRSGQSRSA
jgi:hypothetical protein